MQREVKLCKGMTEEEEVQPQGLMNSFWIGSSNIISVFSDVIHNFL